MSIGGKKEAIAVLPQRLHLGVSFGFQFLVLRTVDALRDPERF